MFAKQNLKIKVVEFKKKLTVHCITRVLKEERWYGLEAVVQLRGGQQREGDQEGQALKSLFTTSVPNLCLLAHTL